MPSSDEVLLRTSYGRALRISLNYLPLTFSAVFAEAFIGGIIGIQNSLVIYLIMVAPFFAFPLWLRRCRVVKHTPSAVTIINPVRTITIDPKDVVRVRLHRFRLGKDTCPAVVTGHGSRVPIVAATGSSLDLDGWRSLIGPVLRRRGRRRRWLRR